MKKHSFLPLKLKKNKGFLIADSLVAVFIVAVALVALAQLYVQGVKATIMADRYEQGVQVCNERMEFIKKGAYNLATGAGSVEDLCAKANASSEKVVNNVVYTVTCSATPASITPSFTGSQDISHVKVEVTWLDSDGDIETISMESFVSPKILEANGN